jgi:membrane protein
MTSVRSIPRNRLVMAARGWWQRSIGGSGWRRMREIDLDTHALALCAQQVLCTAPLIVAMAAVLQRLTGRHPGYFIVRFFGLYGDSADAVLLLFSRTSKTVSTPALVFAMITAIVFTTSVAAVHQRAFELIWTLPRVIGVRSYFRQLGWAVLLGLYSVVMIALGRFARELDEHAGRPYMLCVMAFQGVLTFLFYWWSQHWLLGGRVNWRSLRPGAVCVGLLTTVLFRLTRVIMPGQVAWQVHAYGLIGAVFVLSVWLMILSAVIFTGILLGAVITERRLDKKQASELSSTPLTVEGLTSVAEEVPEGAGTG